MFFALVGTFTDNIRYLMISAKIARFRNRASKTSNKLMLLNNWRENPFLFWVAHSRGGEGEDKLTPGLKVTVHPPPPHTNRGIAPFSSDCFWSGNPKLSPKLREGSVRLSMWRWRRVVRYHSPRSLLFSRGRRCGGSRQNVSIS